LKNYIKSAVVLGAFCSTLSLAQVPEDQSPVQSDQTNQVDPIEPIDPVLPTICTSEAKLLCVETRASGHQLVGVGRLGPNCEFPTLPAVADDELCVGSTPPILPTACTEEARLLCIEDTETGLYSSLSVGRVGPNCDFPVLTSEVKLSLCSDDGTRSK
jgi:predicted small metal-binding protein